MPQQIDILSILPTPFLKHSGDSLHQIARINVNNLASSVSGAFHIKANGQEVVTPVEIPAGESILDVELAELFSPGEIKAALVVDGKAVAHKDAAWIPPRRWTVHVVQNSHHDIGYTDLASHVIFEHDRWLDSIIDMVESTRDFPEDARFRAVIEQTWSLDHYLSHAKPERVAKMLDLLKSGDIEMTALFGNMVTELCGHESLARSTYHSFRIKRQYGIPFISAEHNDIPGFTWGLSQVLTEAGVRIFCPGLPLYYSWGHPGAPSFWDEAALFGASGIPGAFWWEAPNGKRVLFWSNNQGCGGDCHVELPTLAPRLQELAESKYPYSILRWPVLGGARDNSPYIDGYTKTIKDWNERWAYPHLVSSTNARFYEEFLPQLPDTLPVIRGDVPGQDYPVGATSTAAATGINRRTHTDLPAAEALATMAGAVADYRYQSERIFQAYEETLWHDEHTWGHHFPSSGPTAITSEMEKAVHAYRGAALAHDVVNKAMARVADSVHLESPGLHLVVFNPSAHERSGIVRLSMREFDNCGSDMVVTEDGSLRGVILQDRWHVNPEQEYVDGKFDLIDVETGRIIPFQINEIESPLATMPYAAQRLGIANGGKRYGVFEDPIGLKRDLVFFAEDVGAVGYRTYFLRPREDQPVFTDACSRTPFALSLSKCDGEICPGSLSVTDTTLENSFYRLELDPNTGDVCSLLDKETGRELIDPEASPSFGSLVIRDPFGGMITSSTIDVSAGLHGPLEASLNVSLDVPVGHPCVEQTYTLHANEKRLDVAVNMLKDPTPLLEVYMAFPFNVPAGKFRYEGPLCAMDPAEDLMPGAYADRLTVQNWVSVSDDELSILWSSMEAPVVSLAQLWPGRVSPAHSAKMRDDVEHPQPIAEQLRGGTIYSLLTANNFGTNFSVTQCGSLLYRYSITTTAGPLADDQAVDLGQQSVTPFSTIFTEHPGTRPLAPTGSFLSIDKAEVQMVTLKRAENADGLILRLWNPSNESVTANVALPQLTLTGARLCNLGEEVTGEILNCDQHSVTVPIDPRGIVTVRLLV